MKIRLSVSLDNFKYPDGTVALSDIRFEVPRGEFTGILGSNGSGKTTLLKIMDGLIKDYAGIVLLDGEDIRGLPPRDIYRRMGLVFQNPDDQLFAHSVFEDVAFGPRNMGFAEEEIAERVERALANVEMEEYAGKSIHHLSFGQKKRVCIAGLLAMGHEILLLDEPTAGLDPMGEYRMMELLTRLNRENGGDHRHGDPQRRSCSPLPAPSPYPEQGEDRQGRRRPKRCSPPRRRWRTCKLRLPHIAELIYRLKHEDKLPFDRMPLTIGEARREIVEKMKN